METAIVVNEVKKNQLFFDITQQSNKHEVIVYSYKHSYLNNNFGFNILTYYDIWNSNAKRHISTCLNSSIALINNPKIEKFYFYIWDFEWLKNVYDFYFLKNIYKNKKVLTVVRSINHKKIFDNIWNTNSLISENFELSSFIEENNEKTDI